MRVLLFMMIIASSVLAETYEEYLRSQEQAFNSFKEERDREFSAFLNKEWKAYKEAQSVKAYEEKKPKVRPKAVDKKVIRPVKRVLVTPEPISLKKVKVYKQIVIPPPSAKLKTLYLNFFGVDLEIHYDKSILISMSGTVSKEKIASSWDTLAKSEYETTVSELKTISKKLKLNDWAKYLLVQKVSRGIYKSENTSKLFSWFVLLKMGYDAHIAYQNHKTVLLLPVKNALYSTVYYTFNNKKYYAIGYYSKADLGSLVTYDNIYKGATLPIDFGLEETPLFTEEKIKKHFVFRVEKKNRSVDLDYNKNLMSFFQTYPQVAYENYFSAPESTLLENSIKVSFKPLLLEKSQSEALDIILNFVQNAFKYQVDDDQFNKEKVMFPSETLFYPYSDCEDRAILFSYMVKTLLAMDVVGVKYSNHMATAVKIDEKIKGEYIISQNRPYIVADPTYLNARVGMSMPQFIGSSSYEIVASRGEK